MPDGLLLFVWLVCVGGLGLLMLFSVLGDE